jgi:uncharacterized protein
MRRFISPSGILIGLATGLLSGLMGVGGGIIAIPLMVGVLKVTQHKAHGTSLGMMVLTASAAGISYALNGKVEWVLALVLMVGTVTGSYFGARLMAKVPADRLKLYFGLFIFVVGLWMLLGPRGIESSGGFVLAPESGAIAIAIGLIAGVLSGLLGIGGGVVMVPAMGFLLGIEQHVAQGVSLVVIVPTAITGALTHYKKGNLLLNLAVSLGIAAIVGSLIGSTAAQHLPGEYLYRGFGVFVVATATKMLSGSLGKKSPASAAKQATAK